MGLPRSARACLFDLDGVLTQTAKVHAQAWKQMFDAFLAERAKERGEEPVPFDAHDDYDAYVDGKPRYLFPRKDCALLPIPNTTVEMLAEMLAHRLHEKMVQAGARGLKAIEMEVEESFGQSATCRVSLT